MKEFKIKTTKVRIFENGTIKISAKSPYQLEQTAKYLFDEGFVDRSVTIVGQVIESNH